MTVTKRRSRTLALKSEFPKLFSNRLPWNFSSSNVLISTFDRWDSKSVISSKRALMEGFDLDPFLDGTCGHSLTPTSRSIRGIDIYISQSSQRHELRKLHHVLLYNKSSGSRWEVGNDLHKEGKQSIWIDTAGVARVSVITLESRVWKRSSFANSRFKLPNSNSLRRKYCNIQGTTLEKPGQDIKALDSRSFSSSNWESYMCRSPSLRLSEIRIVKSTYTGVLRRSDEE
jgi:hypothetical protein